jgi:hypothetical protein
MNYYHLEEANSLMNEFPEETKGFTVFQVHDIWEAYSDSMAAGWLTPDQESVERVFDRYRNKV